MFVLVVELVKIPYFIKLNCYKGVNILENKKIYKLDNKIHENQIVFVKDNKIEVKNTPSYGTIKFNYQNNKLTFIETSVTEK